MVEKPVQTGNGAGSSEKSTLIYTTVRVEDQESSAAEYNSSPGLLGSDGTQEVSMEEDLG